MDWPHLALLHLLPTAYMTGVIWMCQIAHYPLLSRVGAEALPNYQSSNTRLTTWVVLPPMMLELSLATWMVFATPPSHQTMVVTAAALLALCWISTFVVQVPLHHRLTQTYDLKACQRLVTTNWIRTIAWSGRSMIACAILW